MNTSRFPVTHTKDELAEVCPQTCTRFFPHPCPCTGMHAGVLGTFSFKRKILELIIGGKKKFPANALSRGMFLCVLGEAGSSPRVWDTEGFPCHSRRPTGAASLPEKPGKLSQREHRGPYRGLLKVDVGPKEMDFHRRQLSERETPPAVHIF